MSILKTDSLHFFILKTMKGDNREQMDTIKMLTKKFEECVKQQRHITNRTCMGLTYERKATQKDVPER